MPKGASTQRLALGALDPATHLLARLGVTIVGSSYDGAVDEASALRRSVGKRLVFRLPDSKDTFSALVLGVDPLRLQLPDGRMSFAPPGTRALPSRGGRGRAAWSPSEFEVLGRQDHIRLGYFTRARPGRRATR